MGLFDTVLSAIGLNGVLDATMDSLGLSPHGRDQYVSQNNQRDLMALQNHYNREMFDYQFEQENAEFDRRFNQYQSPAALVKQYSEAGLNPAALMQNGSTGFGGVGSAVNPTGVSVAPTSPSAPMSQSSKSSTDYIDALSRLKLNDAQSEEIFQLLSGKLREQDDQHSWQLLLQFQQKFENELLQKYGDAERGQQVANLVQEGLLLKMQSKESDAYSKLLQAKKLLAEDEHKFNDVKFPKYGLYLDALIQSLRSESSRNYSESSYNSALAKTENAMRGFRLMLIDNEVQLSSKTLQANIDNIINEGKRSGYLPDLAEQELEMAKKENNMYYAKEIIGLIMQGFEAAMYARTGGRIATAMEVRNSIEKRIQDFKESNPVREKVVDTFDKGGRRVGQTHSYQRNRPQRHH